MLFGGYDAAAVTKPMISCPICNAHKTDRFCEKNGFSIFRCAACGHGFVFPRPAFEAVTAANAQETAASSLGAVDVKSTLARHDVSSLCSRIAKATPVRGRSLDVGAGDGAFSVGLAEIGFRPHLIDLDSRTELTAKTLSGGTFARETFEGLSDRGPYGCVLMSQVLEHALDPMAWLRQCEEILMPGGVLAVALPNFGGIYRLLGSRDPYLIPPVHVNFFTPTSMRIAAGAAGLEVVRLESDSHIGARRADGKVGGKRAVLSAAMTALAPIIDPMAKGIILWAFLLKRR